MNQPVKLSADRQSDLATVAAAAKVAIERKLAAGEPVTWRDGFGLWADHPVDGLDYQRRLREEW